MTARARFLAALLPLVACAEAQPAADLFERMAARVEAVEGDLVALRHDLHRHPEVSGEEARTAGVVAAELRALGFEVRTGVGGHGVIGVLAGGRPGPTVAFRADLDAVRSAAPDPVAYRSVVPGVRHICGHDVHTTIGVGLAHAFAAVADDLPGAVMLVFQPAEETGTGARAMLADGAFADPPDAVFAVHTTPYPVGEVATAAGGMMAGRARFDVRIGGEGDRPAASAAVRRAVESVATLPPDAQFAVAPPGFVFVQTFGASGDRVRGQIMTAGPDDRDRAKAAVLAALDALALPGIDLDVTYDERFMDGVTNDPALVARANAALADLVPDVTVRTVGGAVPAFSEDFGSFQALAPGAMYFLGVSDPAAGTVGMPHTPDYVASDDAIAVGTRAMAAAMLRVLAD